MMYNVIFFIVIAGILWTIDINIIRSIMDKFCNTDKVCKHTDIELIRYEKHLTKNVIIGITPWDDLCSINDLNKEFEEIVCANMNKKVRVYYTSMHQGVFLFSETNRATSVVPVIKKSNDE